ncbi:unnamed protein product [Knipowitschia caucasica]|uniref:C2H2-type domain-containing protein n=1 Tax=Knipowitschia caucasica TaxID=637954 RepID=A0AAV2JLG6_KNICA
MDSVDICAATSTADNDKRRVRKKEDRDWLKRLQLRKASLQPPAMRSADKQGPKKIAGSTTWPSSHKLQSQEAPQRTIPGAHTLRFRCSQCTDNTERAPKDLLKHFDEKHKGCPPVFSCQSCKFTTHEFSYLQVHVLSHKDTFSCCSLCNDDIPRSWAEFSAHLSLVHARNGKYLCEVCEKFSTPNDKEFLEHVLLHSLGLDMKTDQKLSTTACVCQFCGYEASQKVILTNHMKAAHRNLNVFPMNEAKTKPRITRSAVKDLHWLTQDCLSLPGRDFLNTFCHLSDAQTTLEDTQQFLMSAGKQHWSKALKNVLSNVPQDVKLQSKMEFPALPDSSQDVLMVKNKINQNGGSFAIRLKRTTEKQVENTSADSCGVVSDTCLNDCLQMQEGKLRRDTLMAVESTHGAQAEENRENQKRQNGATPKELKAEQRKAIRKAAPKKKRKNMRWKNAKRSTKKDKLKVALALKIVLKKNPKKGKRWVTQASKCSSIIENMKNNKITKQEVQFGGCGTTNMAEKRTEELQDGGRSLGELESVLADGTKAVDLGGWNDVWMEACPLASSVITPQTETPPPSSPPPPPAADFIRPAESPVAPVPFHCWSPVPKSLERTLNLVAINAKQPVKRPAGEQPVVVLNHPDADIPAVTEIMRVVSKHKGEVRKVLLSKRTLNALSDRDVVTADSNAASKGSVRERFLLKLKLRRLSKRKFEVVEADAAPEKQENGEFSCWFCGRAFGDKEAWVVHRQRHLMEWGKL